jgi:Tol biopolymer transport system component
MGEVYRATDSNLKRAVAIKVLPATVAADPERLARFQREAEVLAALNHPNIAAIYGIEKTPDFTALVMELVEGDDLSAVIARGPIALADALPIARQIADALEAAHERGIIHRDLKPANVKVRTDGTVKVLDFGLAKALTPDSDSGTGTVANSPTLTARATQLGTILGTAAYMAPEQAKGKSVDKRADIWAFGVVLFEMLSGRRAFDGDDVSTILAAVIMRDPDWTALPADLPPVVDALLHRCLERDPKARLRDIGEARLILAGPDAMRRGTAAAPVQASASRPWLPWLFAVSGLAAAVFFGALWMARSSDRSGTDHVELSVAPPPGMALGPSFALSPDGSRLVLQVVNAETGNSALWLRDLSNRTATKLPGTDGGYQPFWSPAGTEIGFFADGKLKRTDLQGSPPQVIADAASARGGAWSAAGFIVFSPSAGAPLVRVALDGGKPTTLTTLDATRHEKSHRWPMLLPDGKHLLFCAQTGDGSTKDDTSTIEVLSLDDGKRKVLIRANSSPLYSGEGYLLFWREGALRAQAFDASKLAVSGDSVPIASDVAYDSYERALASVSSSGNLVYVPGGLRDRSNLQIVDRAGRVLKTVAENLLIEGGIALSHDGTRLAASVTIDGAPDADIWIYDLTRDSPGRLTFGDGDDYEPIWSENDAEIAYYNAKKDSVGVLTRLANGQGQPSVVLEKSKVDYIPRSWSKDKKWMLLTRGEASNDLIRYDLEAHKSSPLIESSDIKAAATLSPDNRWLAYTSDSTGRFEVHVQPIGSTGRWQISTQGGGQPMWSKDGRELFYRTPQGRVMAVDVTSDPAFKTGTPHELFKRDFTDEEFYDFSFAPFPDSQKFVVSVLKEGAIPQLTFITHWSSILKPAR